MKEVIPKFRSCHEASEHMEVEQLADGDSGRRKEANLHHDPFEILFFCIFCFFCTADLFLHTAIQSLPADPPCRAAKSPPLYPHHSALSQQANTKCTLRAKDDGVEQKPSAPTPPLPVCSLRLTLHSLLSPAQSVNSSCTHVQYHAQKRTRRFL